jgi:riboflavin kinase
MYRDPKLVISLDIFNLSSREVALLIYLAQNRAAEKEIEITTTQLANFFKISQQTASRCLLKLNDKEIFPPKGLVIWKSSPKGSLVKLTSNGIHILDQLRFELEKALHPDLTSITLKGTIFKGRGEGRYYVSQPAYLKSFRRQLGYEPFHGTLNVRVHPNCTDNLDLIRGSWPIIIEGFESEERPFDDVLCYPLKIVGLDAKVAGIIPRRTHYSNNVLELISKVNIREKLNLKDDDELTIEFPFQQGI